MYKYKYIGYCSRIMEYSDSHSLVQFDLCDYKKVYPFLNNDKDFMDSNNIDENYSHALHAYFEYGVDSAEFEQAKIAHFGESEGLGYLTREFNCANYDVQTFLDKYYIICFDYVIGQTYANGFAEDPYNSLESHVFVDAQDPKECSEAESELLSKFFQYRPIYDMQSRLTSAISNETTFYCAEMLYVGAALCVLVYTDDKEKKPIAIFDMGFGKKINKNSVINAMSKKVIKNKNNLLDTLKKVDRDIDVFLSHWHEDHINIAQYCIGHIKEYVKFFEHANWYVPNTKSPHLNRLRKICDKKLNILNDNKEPSGIPIRVELNERFIYGKVNCSYNPHPHHHGIFVEIELQSGKLLLLAGDCTYGGMLTNENKPGKYDYLQICHHGGNYSLPPIKKNVNDIPNSIGSPGEAYSSADGVSYGHPNATIVNEHTNKKWKCECTRYYLENYLSIEII